MVRFDRAFNIFHPGTCGLRTGPNIINLTVQFILRAAEIFLRDVSRSSLMGSTGTDRGSSMKISSMETKTLILLTEKGLEEKKAAS